MAGTYPPSASRTQQASRFIADEYDVECLLGDDLIVNTGQAVVGCVVTEFVGGAIVAAGTQLERQVENVAVLAGDSRVERQRSRICVTRIHLAVGIDGPDGDHI